MLTITLFMDPALFEKFGLTKNEAVAYFALLQLGPSSVLATSRHTNIKRPTMYLILDELIRKGVAALVPSEQKKLYIALPPDRFEEKLQQQLRVMQKALPELSALYKSQVARPTVRFFESKSGILEVYKEIERSAQKREIVAFLSLDEIPEEFNEIYEVFLNLYTKKGVRGREIISTENEKHFYLERLKRFRNYEFRLAQAQHPFFTDNVIYENKIATFSFRKHFAFVLESNEVAKSWRSLFELAWESARTHG